MTDHAPSTPARPVVAWALGLAGLIPFFATAAALWVGPPTLRGTGLLALLAYAAVILSFLGGVRWGVETARAEGPRAGPLIASVLPALVGWAALVGAASVSPSLQLLLLGAGLLLAGVWDIRSASLPAWYRQLRVALTVGAVAAIAIAWFKARELG